jgi:Yip1 domain
MAKIKFLIDNPYKYFKKQRAGIPESLAYAIIISAVFSVLNQLSIYVGITPAKLTYGHLETAGMIFSSLVGGFIIIPVLFALISYGHINKKNYTTAFFVLVHSATPFMLLGWIPHAAVKVALLTWSFAFIIIGVHIQMKKDYRRATLITVALLLIIAAMSIASQNFVLAPA